MTDVTLVYGDGTTAIVPGRVDKYNVLLASTARPKTVPADWL